MKAIYVLCYHVNYVANKVLLGACCLGSKKDIYSSKISD